jgi:hypothetical protein
MMRSDGFSRRGFLRSGAAGIAGVTFASAACRSAADLQGLIGDGRKRRILLQGGVVLSSIRRSATLRRPTS